MTKPVPTFLLILRLKTNIARIANDVPCHSLSIYDCWDFCQKGHNFHKAHRSEGSQVSAWEWVSVRIALWQCFQKWFLKASFTVFYMHSEENNSDLGPLLPYIWLVDMEDITCRCKTLPNAKNANKSEKTCKDIFRSCSPDGNISNWFDLKKLEIFLDLWMGFVVFAHTLCQDLSPLERPTTAKQALHNNTFLPRALISYS